jgi:serine/threonine protein kinase
MSFGLADRPIYTDGRPPISRVGTVVAVCGAALSLLSFFVLPYVSIFSLSATGAELAGLSADARQLVYGESGGEWLLAWWLLPLTAVAALVIAILELRTATIQARKALAAALVGIGATATVGLLAFFSYLANKSNSDIVTSVTGLGFWLTTIGTLSIAAGGVMMYDHHPRTAAEPVTSFGSGHQQSEFGPYRLESLIGQGAMGHVYRAVDTVRDRVVAIKLLPVQLAANPEFRARFQTESALAARLREPHIVPIHNYGEIDGRLFIDMRLVEGTDLAQLLAHHGPLSPERAVNVVTQVAAALDAAHAAGLAHRDIKPSNILAPNAGNGSASEFVYVADFGLARLTTDGTPSLTMTGATVGSLGYMAPERFTGGHGDHRVDIYALGCLLFETLTGHGPFLAEGMPAIIHAHLNQPPPRPSQERPGLPADLDTVIARAMAKNPDDRYSSAGALAAAAHAAVFPPSKPQPIVDESLPHAAPSSHQETVIPVFHQETVVPVRHQETVVPVHHQQTVVPVHHPADRRPRRHWLLLATALIIAMAATAYGVYVLTPSHVNAGTGTARLTLSKPQVKIGDTYYATAWGFSPGENVRFSWTGQTSGMMGNFPADSGGSTSSGSVFERDPPGKYTITVTGLISGRTASAELQVVTGTDTGVARLVLSKLQVKIGDTYYANAWGFSPGENVRFFWTGQTSGVMGDFPTDSGGSKSHGPISEKDPPGNYTITVTGLTSGRTASAELQVLQHGN